VENQTLVFHTSLSSLGIAQNPRDSHIPTAAAILLLFPTQNQKTRKEVGRCAASSPLSFHDHSALELKTAFMIILGLENAVARNGRMSPEPLSERRTIRPEETLPGTPFVDPFAWWALKTPGAELQ